MSTDSYTQESSSTAITIIIATVPIFLYLCGFQYSTGYYEYIGAKWAASYLNHSETIVNSMPAAISMALGFVIAQLCLHSDIKFKNVIIFLLIGSIALPITLYVLAWLMNWSLKPPATLLMMLGAICLYGAYLSDTISAINKGNRDYFKFSMIYTITGLITSIVFCLQVGRYMAESDFSNLPKNFAVLLEKKPDSAKNVYLISKVDGKFLVLTMWQHSAFFTLNDSLDAYIIQPSNTKTFTP